MDWRNAKVEGDTITIKKSDLERMLEYNKKTMHKQSILPPIYYAGKVDVLTDLLKQFEPLEG